MKKIVIVIVLGLFLAIASPLNYAYSEGDIREVAQYFSSDFEVFGVARIDDAYIGEFQSLIDRVAGNLPPSLAGFVSNIDLRTQIDQQLANTPQGLTYESIREWLGDCVAFGIQDISPFLDQDPSNDSSVQGLILLEIKDRTGIEALLPEGTFANAETVGNYSVVFTGNSYIALSDKWLAVVTNPDLLPSTEGEKLENTDNYQKVVSALPADSYNIVLYANLEDVNSLMENVPNAEIMEGLLASNIAIGATILDERTLTIDTAQDAVSPVMTNAMDLAFANYIPVDTQLLAQSSDLTQVVQYLLDLAKATAPNAQQDPAQQLEQVFAIAGLKLQEDVLSWTTGNYALFASVDYPTIFSTLNANETTFDNLPASFGILFEATDAAKAQKVAQSLATSISAFTASQENVSTEAITVGDIAGTVIRVTPTSTAQLPFPVEIFIGSNSDILYIGALNGAQQIANGEVLANDATFQSAQQYFLPNTTQLFYTDSEGFITLTGVPLLGVLGPSIGNIFANVVNDLGNGTPVPTPTAVPLSTQIQPIALLVDTGVAVLDSSSVTSNIVDGVSISRAVISLR